MTKDEIITKAWESGLIYKKDNEWVFDLSDKPTASILWFAEEILFSECEAIIQEIPGGYSVDPQWVCDMIRARRKK